MARCTARRGRVNRAGAAGWPDGPAWALLHRHRRLRCPAQPGRAARRGGRRPCRGHRRLPGRAALRGAGRSPGRRGGGPGQPGLAAPHLGRRGGGHRHPRVGRRQRQPGHRRRRPGAGHRLGRDPGRLPGRPRLRRAGRRAGRARRGHPSHPGRRARLPGPPAHLPGPVLGEAVRAPGRGHLGRLQRQPVHPLGRGGRAGVGQEPGDPGARAGAGRPVRRRPGDGRPPPDPRHRPGQLHPPAGRARPLVRPPAPFPHGLHPQRRRRAAVGVPGPARPGRGRPSGAAGPGRGRPARAPGVGAAHGGRRPAVDEPPVRAGHPGRPLHLAARPGRGRAGPGPGRGRPGPVRGPAPLGQAVPGRRRRHRPLYPGLPDFAALAGRLDPRGVFANAWLRRHVLGGQGP
jgi:hypothetical protein